jgi:hypothetical protein
MPMRREAACALLTVAVVAASAIARPVPDPVELPGLLSRVGNRVEQYYARAQSIVCLEKVSLQPLAFDFSAAGGGVRQLVYELRISWDRSADEANPPDATVLRELMTVNGHPPRPGDEPECMDPKPVSTEPLALLLPGRQRDYEFKLHGTTRAGRRDSVTVDYKARAIGTAAITWKDECVSVDLPGRNQGRVWVDAQTGDVLRLDEQLIGMFEFDVPKEHARYGGPRSMMIERADSSIRYEPVTFHDPDETIMLPSSIQSLTVIRNAGSPRMRMTQTFSSYKRFMTGGRLVKDADAR